MPEPQLDHPHRCLGCGYSLTGLPDPPRCPECGLLNIPDGYRKQVWDLVDSGKWFFSPMFRPFQKRPPGWWWALDRDGDVRRSYRFLFKNLLIATTVVLVVCGITYGFVRERTDKYTVFDLEMPSSIPLYKGVSITRDGLPGEDLAAQTLSTPDWRRTGGPGRQTTQIASTRIVFIPSHLTWVAGAQQSLWLALIWVIPSLVGVWTQIRKGLPEYALARRTIVAACNYESHRLIYLAVASATLVLADMVLRLAVDWGYSLRVYVVVTNISTPLIPLFAAAGWIGPLRSDFTKQLVRSRLHLSRIIFMYAFLFPPVIAGAIVALFHILLSAS